MKRCNELSSDVSESIHETVADPLDGLDVAGPTSARLDFLSELGDEVVDRARHRVLAQRPLYALIISHIGVNIPSARTKTMAATIAIKIGSILEVRLFRS